MEDRIIFDGEQFCKDMEDVMNTFNNALNADKVISESKGKWIKYDSFHPSADNCGCCLGDFIAVVSWTEKDGTPMSVIKLCCGSDGSVSFNDDVFTIMNQDFKYTEDMIEYWMPLPEKCMYWVGKLKPVPNEDTIAVWGERSE